MIDVQAKIHDKFSVEFKFGFKTKKDIDTNSFSVNSWIYIPRSLDINSATYPANLFYKDIQDNIRFITPTYQLKDIAGGRAEPLEFLKNSLIRFAVSRTEDTISDYEYNIKMFAAIFKSALRENVFLITSLHSKEKRADMCDNLLKNTETILAEYRKLERIIRPPIVERRYFDYYLFGDEFMSNILYRRLSKLAIFFKGSDHDIYLSKKERISEILDREVAYRSSRGYPVTGKDDDKNNQALIYRSRVLKTYIESELFLQGDKKRDGVLVEQIYMSIAAGISMVFATVVAFSFQMRFGNFTMPLFVALVVAYMLKDRIKELMRHYFAHKLRDKYFDNKTTIGIGKHKVGWVKEGMDFITEEQIPNQIKKIRDRSSLVEAVNRYSGENIILYRKSVQLSRGIMDKNSDYYIPGINEIIKFNISNILSKSDDPKVPLYITGPDEEQQVVFASKIYYLNFILQLKCLEDEFYKRYLVAFNREGIREIRELQ